MDRVIFARSDLVATALRVHAGAPAVRAGAVHVVEAELSVPTGVLHVFGCRETPGPEHRAEVPAGRYRLRVSHLPAAVPADSVFNGAGPVPT
ncbi:hypothetical protein [Actinoplanes sp. NPDC023714]|uniref:hypothetical protein n=1 Tax=Actinoplanes sp. NPDC023714 TaxID=3154322 RepID=UPI0033F39EF4